MEETIEALGLQDCFEYSEHALTISDDELFLLRQDIAEDVRQNEIALNRSVEMLAACETY